MGWYAPSVLARYTPAEIVFAKEKMLEAIRKNFETEDKCSPVRQPLSLLRLLQLRRDAQSHFNCAMLSARQGFVWSDLVSLPRSMVQSKL